MGPNSLNNLLAKGGNTQFAKLEPKNIIEICLLDRLGIFDDSQLIPEGNKKQMQRPIKPVAIIGKEKSN